MNNEMREEFSDARRGQAGDGDVFTDTTREPDGTRNNAGGNSARVSKFAYFGTPYVARDTLEILLARGFTPAVVVTSPDAPRGRGLALQPSETKALANERGIPVVAPDTIHDAVVREIKSYGCEYAIVVAYGKILTQNLIDAFPLGLLNIHYSLLPKYRGASPVEAALLHGDSVTGVAIQKMVRELDAGDILTTKEVAISPNETTKELRPRLIEIGAELLAEVLPSFESGTATLMPQNHAEATSCKKIKKEEGLLSLDDDAKKNWNKYRAYAESPGTYFFMKKNDKDMRVKIVKATFMNNVFAPERVVPEGKNEMNYVDFARGSG
jgi:methionyl-tRNA formyltransferase